MELTEKAIISSKREKHCVLFESARRRGSWPVTVSECPWLWEEPGSGPWLRVWQLLKVRLSP